MVIILWVCVIDKWGCVIDKWGWLHVSDLAVRYPLVVLPSTGTKIGKGSAMGAQ